MLLTRVLLVALTLGLFAVSGCTTSNVPVSGAVGGGDAASAPVAAVVTLENVSFTPYRVVIKAGQAVEWVWADGGIAHNVTFAEAHSATMTTGTWYRTFNAPGTYYYECTIHAPEMRGVVVVS